jgi:D-glycero-alpha-D-manno-heptose-7-phosphate kinase
MIISRTPFRISFFGGGTDYPRWYLQHGGQVLATTINKYCYITCRSRPPFMEHRIRLAYSRIENCQSPAEISHPVIRAVLEFLELDQGLEIHHDADLPGRSGMGSSSSFTVGLLQALHALRGEMVSKRQLTEESIHVEQRLVKETVGSQDQTLAAYGGMQNVVFQEDGKIVVRPITISRERREELNRHLMLFYTGIKRTASDVAASYVESLEEKAAALERMTRMVDEGRAILCGGGDLLDFGGLLDEAWQRKRGLSKLATNSRVDAIYAEARAAGALGGKLSGAGGGGFMLLFAPPERRAGVISRLARLLHVPFTFESSGSQIIFYDPDVDYREEERTRSRQNLEAFEELSRIHAGEEVES